MIDFVWIGSNNAQHGCEHTPCAWHTHNWFVFRFFFASISVFSLLLLISLFCSVIASCLYSFVCVFDSFSSSFLPFFFGSGWCIPIFNIHRTWRQERDLNYARSSFSPQFWNDKFWTLMTNTTLRRRRQVSTRTDGEDNDRGLIGMEGTWHIGINPIIDFHSRTHVSADWERVLRIWNMNTGTGDNFWSISKVEICNLLFHK